MHHWWPRAPSKNNLWTLVDLAILPNYITCLLSFLHFVKSIYESKHSSQATINNFMANTMNLIKTLSNGSGPHQQFKNLTTISHVSNTQG